MLADDLDGDGSPDVVFNVKQGLILGPAGQAVGSPTGDLVWVPEGLARTSSGGTCASLLVPLQPDCGAVTEALRGDVIEGEFAMLDA